jgi:hypothetical protein
VQRRIIFLSPQCGDATPFNQTGSFLLFQRKDIVSIFPTSLRSMFLLKKALLDNCTVTLKVIEQQHDICESCAILSLQGLLVRVVLFYHYLVYL